MNLPHDQAAARLKDDIKATKTIAITIGAYLVSYVPTIVYAILGLRNADEADSWFGFVAWYTCSISTAVNPVIYYTRTNRCRSAFKQFLKDPFGSSDYKEKPNGNDNAQVTARKEQRERDTTGGENGLDVQTDANSTREAYTGKRRNAMVILPTGSMDVGHITVNGDGKELSGEARTSNHRLQDLHQVSKEGTKVGDKEVDKKRSLKKKFKKRPRLSKVHSLDVTAATSKTGPPGGDKREEGAYCCGRKDIRQEFSGKRRTTITSSRELRNVRKTAWQDIEEKEQELEAT